MNTETVRYVSANVPQICTNVARSLYFVSKYRRTIKEHQKCVSLLTNSQRQHGTVGKVVFEIEALWKVLSYQYFSFSLYLLSPAPSLSFLSCLPKGTRPKPSRSNWLQRPAGADLHSKLTQAISFLLENMSHRPKSVCSAEN